MGEDGSLIALARIPTPVAAAVKTACFWRLFFGTPAALPEQERHIRLSHESSDNLWRRDGIAV